MRSRGISRRDFLRNAGMGAAALGAAAVGLGKTARAGGTITTAEHSYPEGMKDGIARNPDGSVRYLLSVAPDFQPSDVEQIGGTLEWFWPEAGIAAASSSSQTFAADAEGDDHIYYAVAEPLLLPEYMSMSEEPEAPPIEQQMPMLDAYYMNLQWPLQAIGATRPGPAGPLWQLGDYEGNGVTVGIVDSGMPAKWNLCLVGTPQQPVPGDCANALEFETPFGKFVQVLDAQLHEEFDWYSPGGGGVVPIFRSVQEYTTYYTQYGQSEGLPNIATLTPQVEYYPFEYPPSGPQVPIPSVRFVDTDGETRLIIDGLVGGLDGLSGGPYDNGFLSIGHSTSVSGVIAARHKQVNGSMMGIAPKVRMLNYNTMFFDIWQIPSKVLYAWMRAIADGVHVLNCSWGFPVTARNEPPLYDIPGGSPFSPVWLDRFRQLFINALTVLKENNILVCAAAGNWGADIKEGHSSVGGPWFVLPQFFAPNVLTVSGTAPRDYNPFMPDLSIYNPAPGSGKGTQYNLDRPGVFSPPLFSTHIGVGYVDVAAPAGSYPDNPLNPTNPLAVYNLYYTTRARTDPSNPMLGYHGFGLGTSFAAPTTVGIAALVIEAYALGNGGVAPNVAQLKQIIKKSADDLVGPESDYMYRYDFSAGGNFFAELFANYFANWHLIMADADKVGKDAVYGWGRVNAKKAIEVAEK